MKRRKITDKIIIDLDKTLCDSLNKNYPEAKPNLKIIEKIHKYKDNYRVIIFTSRNMKTYQSDIELIKKNTLPIIIRWLKDHNVFYDEIIIGKPWCGENGFYVDDKSVRPDEFQNLSLPEINRLINK
ncbi:MAG: capsular biosynthesis protein [Verrucomicrobia bacterium TMED44]|nr:MAG: capsular biosynthesis protein [Verrucomicrobia bacterium TMED44]